MQNASAPDLSPSPDADDHRLGGAGMPAEAELAMLREVVRLLPSAVTVQDDKGDFLLVNDAAAAQFNAAPELFHTPVPPSDPLAQALSQRRLTALNLLRSGRTAVTEEPVDPERDQRVFLTAHRPVRIGERSLVLSSASDVSRQKQIEQELFRRAYYDELTDLPTRRVIEKHVGDIIAEDNGCPEGGYGHFALAFLDIDNFKHINDYYGHGTGDGLLV